MIFTHHLCQLLQHIKVRLTLLMEGESNNVQSWIIRPGLIETKKNTE